MVGGGDQVVDVGIAAFDNFQYPIDTILAGHVYRMADVPRWYVPAYVGIKLSLPLIVGACLSLFLGALPRHAARAIGEGRRRETAFVALAALLPLICCVIIHGPGFTGMRHYLFTVPPIAVLAGLGFDGALRALQASHRVAAAAGWPSFSFASAGTRQFSTGFTRTSICSTTRSSAAWKALHGVMPPTTGSHHARGRGRPRTLPRSDRTRL